jgi:hypothetical protein
MKFTTTLILISFIFFQYSCKPKSLNEYQVGKHKFRIEIPSSFKEINADVANKYLEEGVEILMNRGYKGISDQKTIFLFQKGEFSKLSAKQYKLSDYYIVNYKDQWDKMKSILFDALAKETLEMEGATVDSTSTINKINGIDFYVFETDVTFKDLNGKNANLKSIRYRTLIGNLDLVIDVGYFSLDPTYSIASEEKELHRSLKSVKILK